MIWHMSSDDYEVVQSLRSEGFRAGEISRMLNVTALEVETVEQVSAAPKGEMPVTLHWTWLVGH